MLLHLSKKKVVIQHITDCKRLRCRLHSTCYKTGGYWWVFFDWIPVEKRTEIKIFGRCIPFKPCINYIRKT
jgi:hypothetical protein